MNINNSLLLLQLYDPHMSSVNPSAATKKAIRRSFRARAAAYWNPFRTSSRHTATDSSSSQDSVQGAPSNSIVLPPPKSLSFKSEKGTGSALPMVRAISSDTLLTTMDGATLSVVPQAEVRSNLKLLQQDDGSSSDDESFVSESVEDDDDDLDDDSEEELLSVTMIDIDLESRDDDQMSEISNVSDYEEMEDDEYSVAPWMPAEPVLPVDQGLIPSGEI